MSGGAAGEPRERLTVVHVMERWLGATETFIHDALCALQRTRPVVVARDFENLDRFPTPPGGALHRSPPPRGSAAWAFSALSRRLRGGEPHLERLLAREGARAVHAHFGPAACWAAVAALRARLPLLASFYGYDLSVEAFVREMRPHYEELFRTGSVFRVEGTAMKRRLAALECPEERIRVHRIGVDPPRYRFRAREDPGAGAVRLLMCGRMVAKKGHIVALRALARALEQDRRLRLRLVGDGPDRPAVERVARELDLGDRVAFLGALPRGLFIQELDFAHLYLQPSLTAPDGDSEGGAPAALLEAQAAGLPVVATRHADIPEVVREGQSALLAPEGDADALAAALLEMAARPDRWEAMGRAGRAHVESAHDARRLAADLERLYDELVGRGETDGRTRATASATIRANASAP